MLKKIGLFCIVLIILTMTGQTQENTFPAPTGPYQVGVTSRQWVNEDDKERFTTDDPDDIRTVTVWIWYPAEIEEGATPSAYIGNLDLEQSAFILEVESYGAEVEAVLEVLQTYDLHAYADIPVSTEQDTYPVIVYSNIISGLPFMQSIQMQELASHGYIVIDVIHTYGYFVEFTNELRVNNSNVTISALERYARNDVTFVLDQLAIINNDDDTFMGHINLDQIGVSGWSSGGIVLNVASKDERIKAGVCEACGTEKPFPPLAQPFMFIADSPFGGIQADYHKTATGQSYLVRVEGFDHASFVDMVLWPKSEGQSLILGTIEGERAIEILNTLNVSFFDQYLKNTGHFPPEDLADQYPEVTLQTRNVD